MPQRDHLTQRQIEARDWWIVFERKQAIPMSIPALNTPPWVRMWTCDEFRHCWAMAPSTVGAGVMVVQSVGTVLEVDWAPVDIDEAVEAVLARGNRVVQVAGSVQQGYFPPVLCHCVTTTKRLLGIRAPLVHTPRQLWRYVHNRGLALCTHDNHS